MCEMNMLCWMHGVTGRGQNQELVFKRNSMRNQRKPRDPIRDAQKIGNNPKRRNEQLTWKDM